MNKQQTIALITLCLTITSIHSAPVLAKSASGSGSNNSIQYLVTIQIDQDTITGDAKTYSGQLAVQLNTAAFNNISTISIDEIKLELIHHSTTEVLSVLHFDNLTGNLPLTGTAPAFTVTKEFTFTPFLLDVDSSIDIWIRIDGTVKGYLNDRLVTNTGTLIILSFQTDIQFVAKGKYNEPSNVVSPETYGIIAFVGIIAALVIYMLKIRPRLKKSLKTRKH